MSQQDDLELKAADCSAEMIVGTNIGIHEYGSGSQRVSVSGGGSEEAGFLFFFSDAHCYFKSHPTCVFSARTLTLHDKTTMI